MDLDLQVRNVERSAGMLDEACNANNMKSVQKHLKAMNEALDTIKGLYPAGVMPAQLPPTQMPRKGDSK